MDLQEIINAVTTVGFPIVMCLIMFWYVRELNETHKKEVDELKDAVNQMKDEIKDSINNNTVTMQKLVDKLDSIGECEG